jgi:NAD(P)-dependent dehydrogenase (short-subunit alcohol dehydrogenase family)
MDFTAEIAVVTGAASGIGRAVATGLAGNGAVVVAADRDLAGTEETAAAHNRITAMLSVPIAQRWGFSAHTTEKPHR